MQGLGLNANYLCPGIEDLEIKETSEDEGEKMVDFGFVRQKHSSSCKTFESRNPPDFSGGKGRIDDINTGAVIEIDQNSVKSFRRSKNGNYKIRVCRRDE